MNKEILGKVLEFLEIDEEELEKQVATGFMIAGVAGLLYGAKKAKEVVEKKLQDKEIKSLEADLKALFATADMILDKHKKTMAMLNESKRPQAKIKIAHPPKRKTPPPLPPKFNSEEEEGEK